MLGLREELDELLGLLEVDGGLGLVQLGSKNFESGAMTHKGLDGLLEEVVPIGSEGSGPKPMSIEGD